MVNYLLEQFIFTNTVATKYIHLFIFATWNRNNSCSSVKKR